MEFNPALVFAWFSLLFLISSPEACNPAGYGYPYYYGGYQRPYPYYYNNCGVGPWPCMKRRDGNVGEPQVDFLQGRPVVPPASQLPYFPQPPPPQNSLQTGQQPASTGYGGLGAIFRRPVSLARPWETSHQQGDSTATT